MNNNGYDLSGVQAEEQRFLNTGSFWDRQAILILITSALSVFDAVTIFPVFQALFTSSPALLYASVLVTSLMLELVPVRIARLYLYDKYGLPERDNRRMIILIVVFGLLYVGVCALRLANMEVIFPELDDFLNSNIGQQAAAAETKGVTAGECAMVVMQCIANLTSSIICFDLACASDDPIRNSIKALRRHIMELRSQRADLAGAQAEIGEYNVDEQRDRQRRLFAAFRDEYTARSEAMENDARLQLALTLQEPEQLTEVAENMSNVPIYTYSDEAEFEPANEPLRAVNDAPTPSQANHSPVTDDSFAAAGGTVSSTDPAPSSEPSDASESKRKPMMEVFIPSEAAVAC